MAKYLLVFLSIVFLGGLIYYAPAHMSPRSLKASNSDLLKGGDIEDCDGNDCGPRNIFPLDAMEIAGIIMIVVIGGIANSGGGGGGSLLASILVIFFGYTNNIASEIVYGMVFGGALGNFLNIVSKRDPQTKRPMIDYDLALICMPPMLLGSNIGILFARMSAQAIILVGLLLSMAYSMKKIYKNARKQYREETKAKKIAQAETKAETTPISDNQQLLLPQEDKNSDRGSDKSSDKNSDERRFDMEVSPAETDSQTSQIMIFSKDESDHEDPLAELEKFKKEQCKLFPMAKIAIFTALILVNMAVMTLKGTAKFPSMLNIDYCSANYWGLYGLGLVFCVLFFFVNKKVVKKSMKKRQLLSSELEKEPFQLNNSNITRLSYSSFIAGILASFIGVGGGIVIKPPLLDMKVPALTVTATSGFLVMETAFVSMFQALLHQDVPMYDQLFYFGLSLVGSFIVSAILNMIVKKTKRPSLILWSLMFIMAIMLVVTPTYKVLKDFNNLQDLIRFNSLC